MHEDDVVQDLASLDVAYLLFRDEFWEEGFYFIGEELGYDFEDDIAERTWVKNFRSEGFALFWDKG